jgi:hypothetical protein
VADAGGTVSSVGSDRYQEVIALAKDVRELLQRLDPKGLKAKPNPYEPTAAESVALALLQLDRITSEGRIESGKVPTFAADFLNRRLSRRLLDRYHGADLPAEFERRMTDSLQRLADNRDAGRTGPDLERIHRLLTELESALLQRQGSVDGKPER